MNFHRYYFGDALSETEINPHLATGVAINGKRFTGKTTLADMIAKLCPGSYTLDFAYPLKGEFAMIHNIPAFHLYDRNFKTQYAPGLVSLAAAKKSMNGIDYFAKKWATDVRDCNAGFVNGDLRYWYELAQVLGAGGICVRLEASVETRERRGFKIDEAVDFDESECGLDDHPYWAQNPHFVYRNDTDDMEQIERIARQIICRLGWKTAA